MFVCQIFIFNSLLSVTKTAKTMQNCKFYLPQVDSTLDQDEEFFFLEKNGVIEKILFHDYGKIFEIPGLYERIFYKKLKCQSPTIVVSMLEGILDREEERISELRILDLGAGNGMVGQLLAQKNADLIVGVDIIDEAKHATKRDRPGIYEDYLVDDFTSPAREVREKLSGYSLNALVTVAALGFGDTPPAAFVEAFNLIEDGGWIAFNIREKFLNPTNAESSFHVIIEGMKEDNFKMLECKKYVHRFNLKGQPIYYVAFIGRKLSDISIN